MLAGQAAADRVVAVEADGAHGLEAATLPVGDFCCFLEMLAHGGSCLYLERSLLGSLLDGVREQQPPFLIVFIRVVIPVDVFHIVLVAEGAGRWGRVHFAGGSDPGLVELGVGVNFSVRLCL